ncbi:benzoate-CoA ligase family protein [Paracoccus denitrificans]|jgi:benzoate-CoA ligase family protein|uniref:Benzoate-CoA ligase family n=1 Tax=Paracoccus denitrificans (strain Pd 1222) TaxID=318586 RepID=A1AYE4_PARDP|nr:benzoate-CoA ligase family protein [Paracoccus denitrificans]ABL68288.1 benzoate-CoA ligase family [Paracoccus denitrificans PD1222]MBB4627802.1 benzoate-CoA ligase family protein [Paracoccus denitrificans]MCU7428662.1 benzoate-CoA ligase family protein [Paracoccus denitrificans]QAR26378.1 benzoate-CoA ligase family protein [Paracoccus denitrificans]UPV95306.1 benzoate-CoA ligase family protein [Paracoccus denitrificans]
MTVLESTRTATTDIEDRVPLDALGSREIGFAIPETYNASAILFDNLDRGRGGHMAVIGPGGSRTYAQLCAEASRFGNALLGAGLTQGDRILLFLDDSPAYPAALFGAIRAGLVPLLINTLTPPELLNFYLKDSSSRVAIADAAFAARFDDVACAETALERLVVVNGAAPEDSPVPVQTAEAFLQGVSDSLAPAPTGRNDMAFWQYSSGSTGRPKGIVHLQHDMAYTALSFGRHVLDLQPGDICFSVPKIFFAYGLGNSLTFPFSVGATSVLLPGQPRPAAVFEAIATCRPTHFFGLPTLYTAMTSAPEAATADLSSLKLCLSAAEVLANEVAEAWRALSGHDIIEGLGSTEVLHIYLSNTREARRPGAAGLRVPGYEVAIRDPDGNDVPDGEQGVLWVRGDSNAPFYWNRPDKTADAMRGDGWIYTGDRMRRDADGFYYFLGRADEFVKVSGQWVYPLEVELCLADHPELRECAVLAVEMADRRMTLHAFVTAEDPGADRAALADRLKRHVKATLLPYKYPRSVIFLDHLPKTGTGKIDRQALLAIDLDDHDVF